MGQPGGLDDPEALATRMANAIAHRGPDDFGAWADAQAGIALGFRRLSIVDLSPAGHQPMTSSSGRFVMAFNGEIYNHLELRAELEGMDPRLREDDDAGNGLPRWPSLRGARPPAEGGQTTGRDPTGR